MNGHDSHTVSTIVNCNVFEIAIGVAPKSTLTVYKVRRKNSRRLNCDILADNENVLFANGGENVFLWRRLRISAMRGTEEENK